MLEEGEAVAVWGRLGSEGEEGVLGSTLVHLGTGKGSTKFSEPKCTKYCHTTRTGSRREDGEGARCPYNRSGMPIQIMLKNLGGGAAFIIGPRQHNGLGACHRNSVPLIV